MHRHHSVVRLQLRAWRSAARTVLTLVAALVLSLTVVGATLATAPPAHAGCEQIDPARALTSADAVVEGTVVAVRAPRFMASSSDPVTYTIEVGRVYASTGAAVQARIEVRAPYGYGLGGETTHWLLFLRGENPTFETDACSAVELPIRAPEIADEVAGWTSTAPEPGGVEMPGGGVPWLTIGVGGLVLAMVLLLVRDARRRRQRV